MKEFVTAVADIEAEDERAEKINALMTRAEDPLNREDAEAEVDGDRFIEFKLDDRVMRAYWPTEGQLAFMLAALGKGQTKEQRFAAILNIMFEALRGDDRDYLEGRMLTRDKSRRVPMNQIEGIFEYLASEWFRPSVSDGREVVQSGG